MHLSYIALRLSSEEIESMIGVQILDEAVFHFALKPLRKAGKHMFYHSVAMNK